MLDITVIILTKDESLHLKRCLENVNKFAKKVYVIDCFSTDGTQEIAKSMGAEVVEHKWPGNQAEQFNWAIDNLKIYTEWVLRLDADEYLLPELIEEMNERLPTLDANVTGVVFNRRHIFMDKWMRRGIYPVKLMRLFRNGKGRSEQRLMDEHIMLSEGTTIDFNNDFCDHNLNNLSWFCHKHVDYATREAAELLSMEYGLQNTDQSDFNKSISPQAQVKRAKKHKYARQPLFWRSLAYFCYRYFLKGAFLEGKEAFVFTFLQGLWYRTLVDAKVYEIKRKSGGIPEHIKSILKEDYGITI